ncbi:hypothetical protein [Asanoa ferruginea]|uniref:hypothetical protein n=1 Tax=Asanoa ferruginea TaxID=53367 RepID=UPI001EF26D77|nr:hypothetical protein [Asanoa ferruginea]
MPIPTDDATPLDWLLFEQAGVLTFRQAVAHLGVGAVRHRVATNRWRRPRSVYS